ncbi:hypothetical protein [Paenibacillus sp. Y412MC10]|uniref:hypothetical protein n=1 Tax=Geobacillus sp. (strain Y412MC10) TaxID=481743 RepID=UPI0011AB82E7|nr:hypothetical protein [Paenibacillus sp. Y412MC10]
MKKWLYLVLAGLTILNFVQMGHAHNLKEQIKEQRSTEEVTRINQKFIDTFFTYDSTKQRYENIKPLMTEQGYNATLPAGTEIPDDTSDLPSVSSRLTDLRPFIYSADKNKVEYLNEFNVITSYNKVDSTTGVIVHTVLTYSEKNGWLVDDVDFTTTTGNPGK